MSEPCRASKRIGCPDCRTMLGCHQPSPHPGLNHYDAQEQIWWMAGDGAEPELFRKEPAVSRGSTGGRTVYQPLGPGGNGGPTVHEPLKGPLR